MKHWPALPVLLLAQILLALGLAAVWFTPQGQPRLQPWQPPEPIVPEAPQSFTESPAPDLAELVALINERPLFAPDRRPPPPPSATVAPPPDPLDQLRITGIVQGDVTLVIAHVEGRVRRIALNERVGPWTLTAVEARQATFTREDQERQVPLTYARLDAAPNGQASPGARPEPQPEASPQGDAAQAGASASSDATPASAPAVTYSQADRLREEQRERLRRRNEVRIRAGLPPLPEPNP